MDDEDLKSLGLVLDQGQAGPIVVFAPHMADQIAANIKSLNKAVSNEIDANLDELARQLQESFAACSRAIGAGARWEGAKLPCTHPLRPSQGFLGLLTFPIFLQAVVSFGRPCWAPRRGIG
jgi:hypothetical protein